MTRVKVARADTSTAEPFRVAPVHAAKHRLGQASFAKYNRCVFALVEERDAATPLNTGS